MQACGDLGGKLLVDVDGSLSRKIMQELHNYDDNIVWWIALRKRLNVHWSWDDGDLLGKVQTHFKRFVCTLLL